ncbi:hypothetical protein [Brevibacillus laterosporus]|uniref:hypothetical protein n=1 Tax=Brevibacillus laterosporus TaxID=1465 RepID=UPI000E6D2488|nr:hypothetical protein [Brevibacillus laterosporus]AYB37674.1 hypothetical protein D5F52_04895 [Brevibacillus laterosporus]MBM7111563.1 hypothetical protein [Brevibacillus laterosporus]
MDRFNFKDENELVGRCLLPSCNEECYEGNSVYFTDEGIICSDYCLIKYTSNRLGVVFGTLDKDGQLKMELPK